MTSSIKKFYGVSSDFFFKLKKNLVSWIYNCLENFQVLQFVACCFLKCSVLVMVHRVLLSVQFSSVQFLSCVQLFVTPWTAACQASLPIANSRSLLKLTSIESVMPSNHLILCHPLLFLPSVSPSISVFSSELVLHIGWPKYWSFSFSISLSSVYL